MFASAQTHRQRNGYSAWSVAGVFSLRESAYGRFHVDGLRRPLFSALALALCAGGHRRTRISAPHKPCGALCAPANIRDRPARVAWGAMAMRVLLVDDRPDSS